MPDVAVTLSERPCIGCNRPTRGGLLRAEGERPNVVLPLCWRCASHVATAALIDMPDYRFERDPERLELVGRGMVAGGGERL